MVTNYLLHSKVGYTKFVSEILGCYSLATHALCCHPLIISNSYIMVIVVMDPECSAITENPEGTHAGAG